MQKIAKDSQFYYPLTPETVNRYFLAVFSHIANHQCVNFQAALKFGGLMRLIRFMVSEVDFLAKSTNLPISSKEYRFVIINQEEMAEGSAYAYFHLIYKKLLEIESINHDQTSQLQTTAQLVEAIKLIIQKITQNYNLVMIVRGVGHLDFADKYFWNNFVAIRPSGIRDKLRYIFITYEDAPETINNPKYEYIKDLLEQNIVKYDYLSSQDIDYLVARWSYVLNKKYSDADIMAIKNASRGNPLLLKYATFCLENGYGQYSNAQDLFQNNHYINHFFDNSAKTGLIIDYQEGYISFNGTSVLNHFSPGESDLLFYFAKNEGKTISKDEIANVIWAGEADNDYSDWAISQWIKRLRSKLKKIGVNGNCVKTIRLRGYQYIKD